MTFIYDVHSHCSNIYTVQDAQMLHPLCCPLISVIILPSADVVCISNKFYRGGSSARTHPDYDLRSSTAYRCIAISHRDASPMALWIMNLTLTLHIII